MVTIMARSAYSPHRRAHFNKRHSLGLSLESLETRVCLSANLGLASQNHQQIQWNGHTVEARADSWIVHTASTSLMPASSFNLATHWQTASLGEGFYSLTAPGAGVQDVVNWAAGTVGVASVEPDFVIAPTIAPNDPTFSQLWGLNNVGQSGGVANADINAPEAWNTTTGSRTVVVAVIDTGIDYTHPDLAANAWHNPGEVAGDGIDNDGNGYVDDVYGWDFANNDSNPMDDNGHGTHVSGTIGAVGNNGVGVAGVNWQVSIMGLKFLSGAGSGSTSGAIAAINYATRMRRDFGINIVASNNSWGGGGFSTSLRDAIEAGGRAGILFVAAAGNEAGNNDGANTSGDVDMFAITVAAGMAITVDVDAGNLPVRSTLNSFASVFDVAGRQLTNNDDFGGSQDSYLVFVAPAAGTYYVGLSASRNSYYNPLTAGSGTAGTTTGAYAVTFTVTLPLLAADIIDVTPDPRTTAVAVVTGDVRLAGRIGDNRYGAKDVDFYRVSLRAGQQFVIDIDARSLAGSSTLDSYVRLFNAKGRQLASNDDSGGSLDSYLVYTAPTAGTYFVGVSGYGNAAYTPMQDNSGRNGSVGTYQISLGVSSMPARSNTNTIHMLGFADGDVTPTHNARRFQMQAAFAAFGASWMGTPQPSTGRTTLFTL